MYSDDDDAHYYIDSDDMWDNIQDDIWDENYYDDSCDDEFRYTVSSKSLRAKLDASPLVHQPKPLVDICSKFLALNFPFAYVQDRSPPVPDDLQLKVINFSFPESEEKIRKYAEFSRPQSHMSRSIVAIKMHENGPVTNMMQIGFRLSAAVDNQYVTIHFDRGKITMAHCTCDDKLGWCFHVLETVLARIRNAGKMDKSQLRLPVSDSLNTLSREQLLKLSHYLLYHHQNDKMVETTQDLIDKLVNRHGDYDNDDINVVQGAPDPTAGPGLDEESHWFVCEKGFKERFHRQITNETLDGLGFVSLDNYDNDSHLHELWYKNRCHQPLVKDGIDDALEFSSYPHGHNSCNILETVLELVQDDSTSGLKAIKSCTEEVLSCLDRKKYRRIFRSSDNVSEFYPSTSQAMGFTARPFRAWTLCDELSILWQVAVLNPKFKASERQQAAQELLNWNQEALTACNLESLIPWKGLEVAYNLCQHVNWNTPEMLSVLCGDIPEHCSISGIILVEVKREDETLQCHLPYCFTYGSITFDILTWCAIIHALEVYKYRNAATSIAFSMSLALISLYQHHAETRSRISDIPIVRRCLLEHRKSARKTKTKKETKREKKARRKACLRKDGDKNINASSSAADYSSNTSHEDTVSELRSGVDATADCLCPSIWPSDAFISLRCFAFLYNIVWSNKDMVEKLIVSQKHKHRHGESELCSILHSISEVDSLVFQVGVLGLLLPKFPMTSKKHEVESYDLENWLSFHLLDMQPRTPSDLEFLDHSCKTVNELDWPLSPCSSFTRIVLHHTYKSLSTVNDGVLELVMTNLQFSFKQDSQPSPWGLFELSTAISWSKLAELCLTVLVVSDSSHKERALDYILNGSGVLGQGVLKLNLSSEGASNKHFLSNILNAKSKISFALARAIFARLKKSNEGTNPNCHKKASLVEFLPGTGDTGRTLERCPQVNRHAHTTALKKFAIRLGAHSLSLENTSRRSYSYGSDVKWLLETSIDCGLWGVRCLLSSHDDVNDFLQHNEAIDLCRMVLKKKDDSYINLVKEVLLSLLRDAVSNYGSNLKIQAILLISREHNKNDNYMLTPWVCEHLRDLARTNSLHHKPLMSASEEMFTFYKEKLTQTNFDNKNTYHLEGLRELFDDEADDENEDLNKSCSPVSPLNPYMTSQPHPYLELSYDLGMMGLHALLNEDDTSARETKEHLKQLGVLVAYITRRKWLLQSQSEHGEEATKLESLGDKDTSFLIRAVDNFLKLDTSAMMLMTFLYEIAANVQLPQSRLERLHHDRGFKQELFRTTVEEVPELRPLLERTESKFRNLLLGSKMDDLVKKVTYRRSRSPEDLREEFEYATLEGSSLRDTLNDAKIIHDVGDPSGTSFKRLVDEIMVKHNELKGVLDGILSGEEPPPRQDREDIFHQLVLWSVLSQQFRRDSLDFDFY